MNTSSKIILSVALVALSFMLYRQQEQIDTMQARILQLQDSTTHMQDKLEELQDQIDELDDEFHPDSAVQKFLNNMN